jgi:hypothetical protein
MAMVQDASFLMMLSTNLYSNQQLACIRETLCNAWDAHIEAGTTGTPVKVTITAGHELIIEDSGHGIPEDLFEQIYGTFGGSTKRQNKAVTGGFGLGCKSPWAYTESFRVTSENQGKKVVYNLVRASVEADGLPAITRVMEMPTERSGLTVRFQLREQDVPTMKRYIHYVAMHGDMLVDFEHVNNPDVLAPNEGARRLPVINLDATPGSYDVDSDRWYAQYMGNHQLFMRYGAVIYPMLETPGTQKAVDLLKQFMEIVGFRKMVVQAAPGTLALTPNRESLSSSKMTEDGITDLCVALVARIEEDIIDQIPGSIRNAIEQLKKGSSYQQSLEHRANLPGYISPMPVHKYLQSQLGQPKWAKYERALREAEQAGFKKRHVFVNKAATKQYHRLRRRLRNTNWTQRAQLRRAFAHHFVLRPLSRVVQKHKGLLKLDQLAHSDSVFSSGNTSWGNLVEWVSVESFDHIEAMIDQPTVFITSRTKYLGKSIKSCPDTRTGWVYKIAPRDSKREAVVKAFEDGGYKVVDLTLNHDWDDGAAEIQLENERRNASRKADTTATLPGVASKKVANQLMSLSNVYDDSGKRRMGHERIRLMKSDLVTTDEPLFYVPLDDVGTTSLGHFGSYLDLDEEERERGVIVRSGIEKNMAIKRGTVDMNTYLAKKLWDRVHSKAYQDYFTKQRKDALFDQHHAHPDHLDLLAYLGVKLAGLDKLVTDPTMERDFERIKHLGVGTFMVYIPDLTLEQRDHYNNVIQKYKLVELPAIRKLKAMRQDPFLQPLFAGSSKMLEVIRQYPDRKAAIKSLVMSAFKNGN